MNCADALRARGTHGAGAEELSRQISRVKNSVGMRLAVAVLSMMRQSA